MLDIASLESHVNSYEVLSDSKHIITYFVLSSITLINISCYKFINITTILLNLFL